MNKITVSGTVNFKHQRVSVLQQQRTACNGDGDHRVRRLDHTATRRADWPNFHWDEDIAAAVCAVERSQSPREHLASLGIAP